MPVNIDPKDEKTTTTTKRAEILNKVEQIICRDRQDVHGAPENTFAVIASYWSAYLSQECGREIDLCDIDAAVMMTLFKIARLRVNPNHDDNILDAIGYLAIAGELIDNVKGSDELLNQR